MKRLSKKLRRSNPKVMMKLLWVHGSTVLTIRRVVKKLVVTGVVLLSIFVIFQTPRYVKISEIQCHSQFRECNEIIMLQLEKVGFKDYKTTKNMYSKVLSNNVLIDDFSIHLKLPHTIDINVIQNTPKYAISTDNKIYALLDKNGKVISFTESTNLPVLIINKKLPNLGVTVSENTLFALALSMSIASNYDVQSAIIIDDSLQIELKDKILLMFPLFGEKEILLGSLNLLLSRLKEINQNSRIERKKEIHAIDFRYKNPILR